MGNRAWQCVLAATFVGAIAAQAPMRGHVVDTLIEPVPAAEVWANDATDQRELWRTKADGSGEFGIPAGHDARIVLHATAAGRTEAVCVWRVGTTPPLLQVRDAEPLAGDVVDAQGHPVAGAFVRIPGASPVTTDAQGHFRCEKAPFGDGDVGVEVVHEVGTVRATIAASERERAHLVLVDAGPPIRVRIRGAMPAELRGCRLELSGYGVGARPEFDAKTGWPKVQWAPDPQRVLGPLAGADTFVVLGLGRRVPAIRPRLDGYVFTPDRAEVAHDARERALEFVATPAPPLPTMTVRGVLLDNEGQPLAGQDLAVDVEPADTVVSGTRTASARTGSDGSFVATREVPDGSKLAFALVGGPWVLATPDAALQEVEIEHRPGVLRIAPRAEVTLSARRGAEVRGRVLGADGVPRAFVSVTLQHSDAALPHWGNPIGWQWHATATTDANGRYAFTGLGNCGCEFRIAVLDLAGDAFSESFPLDPAAPTAVETLRLQPHADLLVTVRDAAGAAVPGAALQLRRTQADDEATGVAAFEHWLQSLGPVGTTTDRQGRARMPWLRAGDYELVVYARGRDSAPQTVHIARGERVAIDVVLP